MNTRLAKLLLAFCTVTSLGASAQGMAFDNPHWGDEQFKNVIAGLTQDQVRSVIGKPSTVVANASPSVTQWVYRYTDIFGFDTEFDVNFDEQGLVTSTDSVRLGG
jgi:outer membrane protein assembly factor BamE (lipoprotein component of BamABCDE complex)